MRDNGDHRVWLRDDIAQVLMGVNAASRSTPDVGPYSAAFRDGFISALVSVGLVFGVKPNGFLTAEDIEALERRKSLLRSGD